MLYEVITVILIILFLFQFFNNVCLSELKTVSIKETNRIKNSFYLIILLSKSGDKDNESFNISSFQKICTSYNFV